MTRTIARGHLRALDLVHHRAKTLPDVDPLHPVDEIAPNRDHAQDPEIVVLGMITIDVTIDGIVVVSGITGEEETTRDEKTRECSETRLQRQWKRPRMSQ